MCQEFLSSAESRDRAARLRAEEEARQREVAAEEAEASRLRAEEEARLRAAAVAEAARLRAEEEAQQRAAAALAEAEVARLRAEEEAEAARYRWLQQRLVDREVDPAVASVAAKLLYQADITSDRTLADLTEDEFKELLTEVITSNTFALKTIVLRRKLIAVQLDVKV